MWEVSEQVYSAGDPRGAKDRAILEVVVSRPPKDRSQNRPCKFFRFSANWEPSGFFVVPDPRGKKDDFILVYRVNGQEAGQTFTLPA